MMRKRGFTLIEILCVIAIIASLAAILFPVFAQAKGSAKRSVCLSNLSQIGKAIVMYRSDSDDRYPYAIDGQVRANAASKLPFLSAAEVRSIPDVVDALSPYTKDRRVFSCPVDSGIDPDLPTRVPSSYVAFGTSYGFLPILGAYDEAQASEPSSVLIAHDMSDKWHSAGQGSFDAFMNSLFADGHVHSLRLLSDHFAIPPTH